MNYKLINKNIVVIYFILCYFLFQSFSHADILDNCIFKDHGYAIPVSSPRGIIATSNNDENVVLVWVMDHRGCYELIEINAFSGDTKEFEIPFIPGGDSPSSSIFSNGKYYTHFGWNFLEFSVEDQRFTYTQNTTDKTAMSMTEDDNGIIWYSTYPDCHIFSYNPESKTLKDFGGFNLENWNQYPRYIAIDDQGWVYVAIGYTLNQIIAFNPVSEEINFIIPEDQREKGTSFLFRGIDGKVYAEEIKYKKNWYQLYLGKKIKIEKPLCEPKSYIAGEQNLYSKVFPDGKKINSIDMDKKIISIEDTSSGIRNSLFNYQSQGPLLINIDCSIEGVVYGSSANPNKIFIYDTLNDEISFKELDGQWNTFVFYEQKAYIGAYTKGRLLEWNYLNDDNQSLLASSNEVSRPYRIITHNMGENVIMSGSPEHVAKGGGGLLFWKPRTKSHQLLIHEEIIVNQSIRSLISLNENQILGGTIANGIDEAELFIMDVDSKEIMWHESLISGTKDYSDLCISHNGLIYGIADRSIFFVFDPSTKTITYREELPSNMVIQKEQQMFIQSLYSTYVIHKDGIVRIDESTNKIVPIFESPIPITIGGCFYNGKIYFGSHSKLCSLQIETSCDIPETPTINIK